MTIRHLRIFIAVAEAGTMSLAAKRLYIAQPTVSQAIAEIEADCGARLFERLGKSSTSPGKGIAFCGMPGRSPGCLTRWSAPCATRGGPSACGWGPP